MRHISTVIATAPPRACFLLENLRFFPGETDGSPVLAHQLAALGDFYVNDAFSVCHRDHASISQLPKLLPAFAGLLLEREVRVLSRVATRPAQPMVLILGGAKVADKVGVIRHLLPKSHRILLGGLVANTFLKAQHKQIGASRFDESSLADVRGLLTNQKIVLPTDFAVSRRQYLDIGAQTAAVFCQEISRAYTIIWNGPLGFFEDKRFAAGSKAVAKAIIASGAYAVAGGGDTVHMLTKLRMAQRFNFLSTGGGAMLAFLAGKRMPGIEALNAHHPEKP